MEKLCFTAFDHGITHFDLANNYGPEPGSAEKNFGRIFRENFRPYRDELIISTKALENTTFTEEELKAHYQRGGLGDVKVKKFLNNVMQTELEPIRTRRKEWEQRLPEVVEILKPGSAYAEKPAAATLADVRKSMRIDYFDNDNLLK